MRAPVHVDLQSQIVGSPCCRGDLLRQPGVAAAVVVAVLETQQAGFAAGGAVLLHQMGQLVGSDHSELRGESARLDAGGVWNGALPITWPRS